MAYDLPIVPAAGLQQGHPGAVPLLAPSGAGLRRAGCQDRKAFGGPARGGRSRADPPSRLKPGTVFLREYRASGTPSPSLQRAKTAVAVALEILDTEVRWLASTRAMTFTGLKLKASYASIEGALADSIVEDILQL